MFNVQLLLATVLLNKFIGYAIIAYIHTYM